VPVEVRLQTRPRYSHSSFFAAVATFLLLLGSSASLANEYNIMVVDQAGKPVQNAVVTFPDFKAKREERTALMDQVDQQFKPEVLAIQKNQSVDFPNSDNIRHHVYSFSRPNHFEIKLFSGSESKAVTFEHNGVAVLGCNIHDNMIGFIYISDGEILGVTDNNGKVSIELPKEAEISEQLMLKVWHSRLSPLSNEHMETKVNGKERKHTVTLPMTIEDKPKNSESMPPESSGFKKKFGK
jgi:plastocyanin